MTERTLYSFNNNNKGNNPQSNLLLSSDGLTAYGTTDIGGLYNRGTIFSLILSSNVLTTLYSFSGLGDDGTGPNALVFKPNDSSVAYGTTYSGGTDDLGTVFSLKLSDNTVQTLHSFTGEDGAFPYATLIFNPNDSTVAYGTTRTGGTDDLGTVFSLKLSDNTLQTLHSFSGEDGTSPYAALVFKPNDSTTVYGTTRTGGTADFGTVFSLKLSDNTLQTLHSFSGEDGANPYAALVFKPNDSTTVYGTTRTGGTADFGTVFSIKLSDNTVQTLHRFTGEDGAFPYATLIFNPNDSTVAYGTTNSGGGGGGYGTVFSLNLSDKTLTTLHSFSGEDGSQPLAALVFKPNDSTVAYGTTYYGGGGGGYGTVFSLNIANNTIQTLHNFTGVGEDGANPYAALVFNPNDSTVAYGTTYGPDVGDVVEGTGGKGTIFSLNLADKTAQTLHRFTGEDGAKPKAALVFKPNDSTVAYGTTAIGGTNNFGTVFSLNLTNNTLTTLHRFTGEDGKNPNAALVFKPNDSTFAYGTTYSGGTDSFGTVFSFNLTNNTLTTLHRFTGEDGKNPKAALVFKPNDSTVAYGTTFYGGTDGIGTVFSFNLTNNTLQTLHSFTGEDGAIPYTALVFNPNDSTVAYGTTFGTVFSLKLSDNTLTTLHRFTGDDGVSPNTLVFKPNDSSFVYGTTLYSGIRDNINYGNGTVFSLNLTDNTLTTLHRFTNVGDDGANPRAALVFNPNDSTVAYGTTSEGGTHHYGTIFSLNVPSPTPSPSPTPISNICFPAGTPIHTDQGIIAIELIDTDWHTINHAPIVAITKTVTLDKYLICFKKHSLGKNNPCQDTFMSKDHQLVHKGSLVPAHRFLTISKDIIKVKYSGEILYNVLLEQYSTIKVNNLLCETLHPDSAIAQSHFLKKITFSKALLAKHF
jgi:uncharacterized repeat protein (TIGR03803 family)